MPGPFFCRRAGAFGIKKDRVPDQGSGPFRIGKTAGGGFPIMAGLVDRMVRRMAPWAALLILRGQTVRAADQEAVAPGPVPAANDEVVLLADGAYFPALLDGID